MEADEDRARTKRPGAEEEGKGGDGGVGAGGEKYEREETKKGGVGGDEPTAGGVKGRVGAGLFGHGVPMEAMLGWPGETRERGAGAVGGGDVLEDEDDGADGAEGDEDGVLVFSREGIRELDRRCVEEYGIPSGLLMENAGRSVAEVVGKMVRGVKGARVMVVAGRGNNGGDGLCAARHLHNAGAEVRVMLAAPEGEYAGDPAVQLGIVKRMGLKVEVLPTKGATDAMLSESGSWGGVHVVVDALFGTGVEKMVGGMGADVIHGINTLGEGGAVVASVDVPSGMDAETGKGLGPVDSAAVKADVTVTLVGLKRGFLSLEAQEFVGEVVVVGIGSPRELEEALGERVEKARGEEAGEGG